MQLLRMRLGGRGAVEIHKGILQRKVGASTRRIKKAARRRATLVVGGSLWLRRHLAGLSGEAAADTEQRRGEPPADKEVRPWVIGS